MQSESKNEQLHQRVKELEAELEVARRERDESDAIRSAVADSAVSAVGTAVKALDEIIHLQPIVDAVAAWRFADRNKYYSEAERKIAELRPLIDAHLERVAARS